MALIEKFPLHGVALIDASAEEQHDVVLDHDDDTVALVDPVHGHGTDDHTVLFSNDVAHRVERGRRRGIVDGGSVPRPTMTLDETLVRSS